MKHCSCFQRIIIKKTITTKFYVTKHCKQRYIERTLGGLNSSENILFTILSDLKSAKNITSQLSTENPRFILYIKERYGNIGFNFLKSNHTIFVLTKRKQTNDLYDVITCYIENSDLEMFKNSILTNEQIYLKLSTLKYIKK